MSLRSILSLALFLPGLAAAQNAASLCDSEFGVCLDGKRSDFYPKPETMRTEKCEGYPNIFFYCYLNQGTRDFSWKLTPAKAYNAAHNLFQASGQMYLESDFPLLAGPRELEVFQTMGTSYTFNISYDVDLDAYDPLYFRTAQFGYKAAIVLLCDGRPLAEQEGFSEQRPGSFGGVNTKAARFSAVFADIPSDACSEKLSVRLSYEGQKLRVKKLSVAILNER